MNYDTDIRVSSYDELQASLASHATADFEMSVQLAQCRDTLDSLTAERRELRRAAQDVLDELDIIRRHRAKSGVGYLAVHPITLEALRAALSEGGSK